MIGQCCETVVSQDKMAGEITTRNNVVVFL